MSLVMDLFLFGTVYAHVLLAPYTKVEESFSLHATHDVLMYGVGPSNLPNFDHFVFPGAVPRSFIGSILLAGVSTPVLRLASRWGLVATKADLLIAVRLVLATVNAYGLRLLSRAVSRRFGFPTGVFYTLLTCTQFHMPFWIGRTLPNMFALFPVNLAFYYLLNRMPNTTQPLQRNVQRAVALLTFTAVVFRAEVALLLGPLVVQALLLRWATFTAILKVGIVTGLCSIGFTVLVDSYFWGSWPLWPELYGIYFNVYEGKSADWGVSPFHSYVTTHIPKLLLSSLPLSVLGFIVEPRVRSTVFPAVAFIAFISALGHKEWRFIIYTVPLFNVAAARGARWLTRQRLRGVFGRLCVAGVAGLFAANVLAVYVMTEVSRANYPGGEALARLNRRYAGAPQVHVHIANHAAQTGASLFLHAHAPPFPPYVTLPAQRGWVYNKTEHLAARDVAAARHFTHAITETPDAFPPSAWRRAEAVEAFAGFRIGAGAKGGAGAVPVEFVYAEQLWIMERT